MTQNWGDHCTYCGLALSGEFPRKCDNGHFTFCSPVTVGIALQPVRTKEGIAILAVQRNINPRKGEYALPGGFVDPAELSKPAAVRELFEETGIRQNIANAFYFSEATGGSHRETDPRVHNMYFYKMPLLEDIEVDLTFSNEETQSLKLLFLSRDRTKLQDEKGKETELCFGTHQNAAINFLIQNF